MALGNGERYYSPTLARFIQQDSFTGRLDVPASLNRYSYVHNNPYKYVDPSGNEGFLADGLRNFANSSMWNTGNENFDWWTRFGRNFAAGTMYDMANWSTLGAVGRADNAAKKLWNGESVTARDAYGTTWFGGEQEGWNPGNISWNEAKGFAHGAWNLVKGLGGLALEYNGLTQLYRSYQFIRDPQGEMNRRRQAVMQMWGGIKQWGSDLSEAVRNPQVIMEAADELGADKTAQVLGEAEFEAWMIADAGVGAAKGLKSLGAARSGKAIVGSEALAVNRVEVQLSNICG